MLVLQHIDPRTLTNNSCKQFVNEAFTNKMKVSKRKDTNVKYSDTFCQVYRK